MSRIEKSLKQMPPATDTQVEAIDRLLEQVYSEHTLPEEDTVYRKSLTTDLQVFLQRTLPGDYIAIRHVYMYERSQQYLRRFLLSFCIYFTLLYITENL